MINVVPNLLHVVPVSDDAALDGIIEVEDTPLCLGFISTYSLGIVHKMRDGTYPMKEYSLWFTPTVCSWLRRRPTIVLEEQFQREYHGSLLIIYGKTV